MLLFWLLGLLETLFKSIDDLVSPMTSTFQFSHNANFLAVISYMLQSNHFFPMDTYLVIAGLYFAIYGLAGSIKIVEVILNIVRGAGMRL